MNICPHCHHTNRLGGLLCEKCGRFMTSSGMASLQTKQVQASPQSAKPLTSKISRISPNQIAFLQVKDCPQPFAIKPSMTTVVLGRCDSYGITQPDIDFTPFEGYKKGVSRIHANIYRREDTLMIMDKGSANGTYLNGQRLLPNEVRLLHDGDEISLGQLVTRVYFK